MSNKESRAALIARANALLNKKPYTQEDNALFNSLMKLSDAMAVEPVTTVNGSEFRKKFMSENFRTYQPLNETDNGQIIPSDFEVKLRSLMIANGPLYSGSSLLTNIYTKAMQPTKIAVSDDLSQPGLVVDENTAPSEAELTAGLSGASVGGNSKRFSTGILLASAALATDAWPSLEEIIAKTTAARLSRIQNSTFLTTLKTALAANSSAAVSPAGGSIAADDVYSLISTVGAAYRGNGAAFIMSTAKQDALGALKSSTGKRMFPHVLDATPELAGYPVHVLSGAATGDILFGDYSYIYCKSAPVEMRVLRERFRVEGYLGYIMAIRAEAKWTVASSSDSPVKYLTFS